MRRGKYEAKKRLVAENYGFHRESITTRRVQDVTSRHVGHNNSSSFTNDYNPRTLPSSTRTVVIAGSLFSTYLFGAGSTVGEER